jgi:hypothetical protein
VDATQHAETVSQRDRLEALRDRLERALTSEHLLPRDMASLSREYRGCLAELASLPNDMEVSVADEIAERRRARTASANIQARAKGSS